ncbi:3-deoxy-D-manno-octulosonic acid transferase [Edaphobacter sp. 4G125]|nr:3-deoxy-D-manno-octulosonic acid transferase [Edaphobacter sp. 4G125]
MATSGRYRAGLAGRLGRIPDELRSAVAGRRTIWLHAVSVGEVVAATELIREMRKALPGWVIAVSTTTETGQKLARERLGGESPVFYLPLDFAVLVRRYLKTLGPELLVLMESELWPNLMQECANEGIPIAVINARVSDRSFPRYRRLRALWKPLLKHVSLFLAQSEETATRLVEIGAPEERVRTSGNLKYDIKAAGESAMTALLREKIPAGAKVLVAGSTLDGEEKMLLEAWTKVLEVTPEAVLILAPRRTERFDIVAGLVEAAGFDVVRASKLQPGEVSLGQEGVILLDTIGDLASVYSLGTAAFVGGSLVPMGGHNPLEPARFGVPIIMGESWENFREIVVSMQAAKAVRIVAAPDLANAVTDLLMNENGAKEMGQRGQAVFTAQAGATRRTLDALVGLLGRLHRG